MSKKITNLDTDEKDLLESVEKGEWHSVEDLENEKQQAIEAAEQYLKKNARINIRLSDYDLLCLKQMAAYEGLPYQTLITSILHKYVGGHLCEIRSNHKSD